MFNILIAQAFKADCIVTTMLRFDFFYNFKNELVEVMKIVIFVLSLPCLIKPKISCPANDIIENKNSAVTP